MNCGCPQSKKEIEKKDKYLDLAWELKSLWNIKVTLIPIVIGTLGTVIRNWYKDWRFQKLEDK